MRYIFMAAAALIAAFAAVIGGRANAAPPNTSVVLTCDTGVTATADLTVQGDTIGVKVQPTCSDGSSQTIDIPFRAKSGDFDAAVVTDGGQTGRCVGTFKSHVRVNCNAIGTHLGATLAVQ